MSTKTVLLGAFLCGEGDALDNRDLDHLSSVVRRLAATLGDMRHGPVTGHAAARAYLRRGLFQLTRTALPAVESAVASALGEDRAPPPMPSGSSPAISQAGAQKRGIPLGFAD